MFMPVFFPPSEVGLFLEKTWQDRPGSQHLTNQGPFEFIVHNGTDAKLLPPTMIVGDSFVDGLLRAGMESYFSDLYRVRWPPLSKVSDIVRAIPEKTQFLIIQMMEVNRTALFALADKSDVSAAVSMLAARRN